MRLSHEVIYRAIYVLPRGALKTTLISALRQMRLSEKADPLKSRGNTRQNRGRALDRRAASRSG